MPRSKFEEKPAKGRQRKFKINPSMQTSMVRMSVSPLPRKQGLILDWRHCWWDKAAGSSWKWGAGWVEHTEHPRVNLRLPFHLTSEAAPPGRCGRIYLEATPKAQEGFFFSRQRCLTVLYNPIINAHQNLERLFTFLQPSSEVGK